MAGPCVHAAYPFIQCLVQKKVKTCDDRPLAVVTLYVSPKVARHAVSRLHWLCMLDAGALQISWQYLGNPLFLFESQVFISRKIFQNVLHEFWANLQLRMCPAMRLHGTAVTHCTSCQT